MSPWSLKLLSKKTFGEKNNNNSNNRKLKAMGNIKTIMDHYRRNGNMGDTDLQSTIPCQTNNHAENICTLFPILAQSIFTKRESELDYYHQKVNVRVTSRVAKRLKTKDLGKLERIRKSIKSLGLMESSHQPAKSQMLTVMC